MWIDLLKCMLCYSWKYKSKQLHALMALSFELHVYLMACWVTLTVQNLQMFSHRMYWFVSVN
jgi:hypothetical protein